MSKESITISKEQFHDAVIKANEQMISDIDKDDKANPMIQATMMMQNVMFASLLTKILFTENEVEE